MIHDMTPVPLHSQLEREVDELTRQLEQERKLREEVCFICTSFSFSFSLSLSLSLSLPLSLAFLSARVFCAHGPGRCPLNPFPSCHCGCIFSLLFFFLFSQESSKLAAAESARRALEEQHRTVSEKLRSDEQMFLRVSDGFALFSCTQRLSCTRQLSLSFLSPSLLLSSLSCVALCLSFVSLSSVSGLYSAFWCAEN